MIDSTSGVESTIWPVAFTRGPRRSPGAARGDSSVEHLLDAVQLLAHLAYLDGLRLDRLGQRLHAVDQRLGEGVDIGSCGCGRLAAAAGTLARGCRCRCLTSRGTSATCARSQRTTGALACHPVVVGSHGSSSAARVSGDLRERLGAVHPTRDQLFNLLEDLLAYLT